MHGVGWRKAPSPWPLPRSRSCSSAARSPRHQSVRPGPHRVLGRARRRRVDCRRPSGREEAPRVSRSSVVDRRGLRTVGDRRARLDTVRGRPDESAVPARLPARRLVRTRVAVALRPAGHRMAGGARRRHLPRAARASRAVAALRCPRVVHGGLRGALPRGARNAAARGAQRRAGRRAQACCRCRAQRPRVPPDRHGSHRPRAAAARLRLRDRGIRARRALRRRRGAPAAHGRGLSPLRRWRDRPPARLRLAERAALPGTAGRARRRARRHPGGWQGGAAPARRTSPVALRRSGSRALLLRRSIAGSPGTRPRCARRGSRRSVRRLR